jgi:serine/threonine-protein kinase RsbW
LPATLSSLASVAQYSAELAAAADFAESDAYRLRLALDELFTNIAVHGQDGAAPSEVEMAGTARNGKVVLEVTDWCRPFDPVSHRRGEPEQEQSGLDERQLGGHGLMLLRQMTERLDYQRLGDANRTTIVVQVRRASAVGADGEGVQHDADGFDSPGS